MIVVFVITAALLALAAVMAMIRVGKGPSALDRTTAFDIITSVLIMAVALESGWDRRTDTVPILAALAMVGFVASVTIARFAAVEPEDAGRIKSVEEIQAEEDAVREAQEIEAKREAEIAALRADEEEGL